MEKIQLTNNKRLKIQRANSGFGLFANVPISKGEFVIEYTGKLMKSDEANKKGGRYLFLIDRNWTIDGCGRENLSRYINHSCKPNCEVKITKKHINIFAKRDIAIGEELNYHYGKGYFETFIKPKGCLCNFCLNKI